MRRLMLCLVIGLPALVVIVVAGCIAFGTRSAPPPMLSVTAFGPFAEDRELPPVETYRARDGAMLAYRTYMPEGPIKKVAVLVHGSTGNSRGAHFVAEALREAGVAAYALDIRGHGDSRGDSGPGDIDYLGQLDDDMADFFHAIGPRHPGVPVILVGHSAGGGFVLRIAGGPYGELFDGYVLLAPFLRYDAPTILPGNYRWATAFMPRILGIALLSSIGLPWFQGLPTVAFAVDPAHLVGRPATYSYRLMMNFVAHRDYLGDARNIRRPAILLAGADDDLFDATKYAPTLQPAQPRLAVRTVPGVGHMGLVKSPPGIAAVRDAVLELQ